MWVTVGSNLKNKDMIDWIVEYTEYWFDCAHEYEEQTINVKASTIEEAEKIGQETLCEMDRKDNNGWHNHWSDTNPIVSRTFYRVVEEDKHVFNSSIKENTGIYKDVGYIDSTNN